MGLAFQISHICHKNEFKLNSIHGGKKIKEYFKKIVFIKMLLK